MKGRSAQRSSSGITTTEPQHTEFGSTMAIGRLFLARERFTSDHIGPRPSDDIEVLEAYTGGMLEHLQVFALEVRCSFERTLVEAWQLRVEQLIPKRSLP
jgi:hypothetical protein